MPLSINVGLSRKASKDYQSTGVSINVTAGLDQSLLARPDELQQQIGSLYAQAELALDHQAGPHTNGRVSGDRAGHNGSAHGQRGGIARNGNGRSSNGRGNGGMTDSQRRAIFAIAERAKLDSEVEAREIIGADLDQLTLRQASELIDHLKQLQGSGNGH